MLNEYEIACCIFMTNVVKNKYYPVTLKCLEACSNTDFIDKIYVFNGDSTDDTVEKHQHVPKVEFIDSTPWDTKEFSANIMSKQYKSALKYISDLNKKIIIIILSSDIIFTDGFRQELKANLEKLSSNENYNFFPLPFVKVPNQHVRDKNRQPPPGFYIYSAIKFNEKIKWTEIGKKENKIIGNYSLKAFKPSWKNKMYSYETWFFTENNLKRKKMAHSEWKNKWKIEDIINMIYIRKLKKFGSIPMRKEDHPKEAQELIDMLEEKHLGYSSFGFYNHKT